MKYIEISEDVYEKPSFATNDSIVTNKYPARITRYYYGLIKREGDAIWRQCMPDPRELDACELMEDPLAEASLSPVKGLIHRYPDRVVLLVSNRCPVYCRFCMRKRHVGYGDAPISSSQLDLALKYIADRPEIHDVILSGGDPLMLDDNSIKRLLKYLRQIKHISIIRIGTRIPVTMPSRITPDLCLILKQFHPIYINTHFNHPTELTEQTANACSLLADAGIPLGNQTVLLRGINDNVNTLTELFRGLLSIRVKPYYLHQMDLVKGTSHFRTSVSEGLEIITGLRGFLSGMAIPHYVVDLPGGKGKVALTPDDVRREGDVLVIKTYRGETVRYQDITTTSQE